MCGCADSIAQMELRGTQMSQAQAGSPDRRKFLKAAGVAAASLPTVLDAAAAAPTTRVPAPATQQPTTAGYQFLGWDEAAFTEALVDHMWPADQLSPAGTELGIAVFIDRQLAGAFGQGDRL